MSDRMDAVLASIDAELTKCICGNPIPENGPSLDYCTDVCQYRYTAQQAGAEPDAELMYPLPPSETDGRAINDEVNEWISDSTTPTGYYRDDETTPLTGRGSIVWWDEVEHYTRIRQLPSFQVRDGLDGPVVAEGSIPRAAPTRPVDRYTMGRASYHNPPSMAVPMRNGAQTADADWRAATHVYWCPQVADPAAPTAAELADGVDLTPYLVGLDVDDPRHEIQAGINQMHQDLADRLGCPVSQVRSLTEYLGHQISAASDMTPEEAEEQLLRFIEASNPPEPPTPEDLRRRALEHRRNRNTGPARRDNRRWRNT